MKILVINGDSILTNSSANLCHLAYIRGLVDCGFDVTLLCADGRDYETDSSMVIPDGVKCHTYYGVSLYEKLSLRKKHGKTDTITNEPAASIAFESKKSLTEKTVEVVKRLALSLYGVHGIYAKFVRAAQKFRSDGEYDYILSISTPVTSHLIAHNLLKSGHVKGKHWIQIWEDPWYSDAYGFNGKRRIFAEEKRLLSFAERICYVSPLTLKKQQSLFPESAEKMFWQPLPHYYKEDKLSEKRVEHNVYGYFGSYAPIARNLEPFYQAANATGIEVNICGDPDKLFLPTEKIHIYPRLPLGQLKPIENHTNILIFLCNRKGGQIPGKIYQYSATDKTILFIMDGTPDEKEVIKNYFSPFNRFVFCDNTVEDIVCAIKKIEDGDFGSVRNEPIDEFEPKKIILKILETR